MNVHKDTKKPYKKLALAVIHRAIQDGKKEWLESELSDFWFDVAEISKSTLLQKVEISPEKYKQY